MGHRNEVSVSISDARSLSARRLVWPSSCAFLLDWMGVDAEQATSCRSSETHSCQSTCWYRATGKLELPSVWTVFLHLLESGRRDIH